MHVKAVPNIVAAVGDTSTPAETSAQPTVMNPAVPDLLAEYADVFPTDLPSGLPPDSGIENTIPLVPNAAPAPPTRVINRLSPKEEADLRTQNDDLLSKDFIQLGIAPFGAPIPL